MSSAPNTSHRTRTERDSKRLDHEDREQLEREGYLVIRDFFDVKRVIDPVRREIGKIVRLVAEGFEFPMPEATEDPAAFDAGALELLTAHPTAQAQIYDAMKHLIAFRELVCHPSLRAAYCRLRGTDLAGSANNANGIRLDRPRAMERLLPWHQDFPFQLRSMDGLTFWIPLVPVPLDRGAVHILIGSHRDGVHLLDETPDADEAMRAGYYDGIRIVDEDRVVTRFQEVAPTSDPGDLVVLDFLTLHKSGSNVSSRIRWTCQLRYFNFRDPFGRSIAWAGSFKANRTIREINDELRAVAERSRRTT